MPDEPQGNSRYSRRELIKRAGVGAGGLIVAGAAAESALGKPIRVVHEAAPEANTIKVGFVSPRSGVLGGFGEPDPFALGLARKALAKGLKVGGKTYSVVIVDKDTQSDPARAGQLAKSLINSTKIDVMLSTSTPETNNPVADACEAAGVPCLSTVQPWEAWYFGRGAKPGGKNPFKWTYHYSFGTQQFADAYLAMWRLVPTNKKVGVMYPNDADGNAVRANLAPLLQKGGYTIVDPGPYQDGTTDYSAQIAKFKSENCQIFNTFPIPPDFTTFWNQAAQQGYAQMVKIAQIAKTGLFPSQVEASGALGYNLASGVYWHPTFPYSSKLAKMTSKQLAAAYTKATKKQWNQQLGATMSLLDLGIDALVASHNPKSKKAVAAAIGKLDVLTTVGRVNFLKGPVPHVATTPIIGCQWIKATAGPYKLDNVIVSNADDRKVPIGAKLKPYS
ncbi:MAG TPA: ABC transporter substrate-binding protein [Gaiellaceae bacterium]|jgi:branched-chain amino acid transport system substrate-binding protein|nr:ABC transporter substrate-binding protein [Gaiellaceae bacterium]